MQKAWKARRTLLLLPGQLLGTLDETRSRSSKGHNFAKAAEQRITARGMRTHAEVRLVSALRKRCEWWFSESAWERQRI